MNATWPSQTLTSLAKVKDSLKKSPCQLILIYSCTEKYKQGLHGTFWTFLNHFRALRDHLELSWIILNLLESCWTLWSPLDLYYTLLNILEPFWTFLNISETLKSSWTSLNLLEPSWFFLKLHKILILGEICRQNYWIWFKSQRFHLQFSLFKNRLFTAFKTFWNLLKPFWTFLNLL